MMLLELDISQGFIEEKYENKILKDLNNCFNYLIILLKIFLWY